MTGSIFTGGVIKEFSDSSHLFGSLEGLSIINDKKHTTVFFAQQAAQQIESNILHNGRFTPNTTPEEFTVICSVGGVPQGPAEPVNGCSVTDCYSQYQRPEMFESSFCKVVFADFEKTLQFFRYFADSNHKASMLISACYQDTYRQMRPFLFDNSYHRLFKNRSV
jgi:hypothetical protein